MDDKAATEIDDPSPEAELGDVDDTLEDEEVEGHSMAISKNFDFSGVGTIPVPPVVGSDGAPTPGTDTSTNLKPQVR